jgi:hypothetical protein
MNVRHSIATLAACGTIFATAQSVEENQKPDPVLEAIREFNKRDKSRPNEVSVVLDPVAAPAVTEKPEKSAPPANPSESPKPEPVLVTGTPPDNVVDKTEPPVATLPDDTTSLDDSPKPTPPGLAVRVERIQNGSSTIDPTNIKLLAPFPAKPLSNPPAGWRLESSDTAPPFTRKVEIATGSQITLTVRPHRLVPDADGATVFNLSEPGYSSEQGYQQTATLGAILSNSIHQLDEQSKQMGTAIDSLQQLLISLPKPDLQTEEKPATIRKR